MARWKSLISHVIAGFAAAFAPAYVAHGSFWPAVLGGLAGASVAFSAWWRQPEPGGKA